MQAPASPPPALDYRNCSACGASVHRADVHKNRYGQYICRSCRTSGVRAVGHSRLRHMLRRMPTGLIVFLTVVTLLVLLPLGLWLLAQMHSYSNGGMLDDIKEMVRSINRMAR